MKNITKPENLLLRTLVKPEELNYHGTLFGGAMMSLLDQAGAILSARESKGRIVLKAVKDLEFHKPALAADVLDFYGVVTKVGKTSITVYLEAHRQRIIAPDDNQIVTSGELIYVAVDEKLATREIEK